MKKKLFRFLKPVLLSVLLIAPLFFVHTKPTKGIEIDWRYKDYPAKSLSTPKPATMILYGVAAAAVFFILIKRPRED